MESTLTLQLSTTNTIFSITAPSANCVYGDYIITVLIKLTWKVGQCSDYK